jgi:hypothetical protein
MSHTPGPWDIKRAKFTNDVAILIRGTKDIIAECYEDIRHHNELAKDEALANAFLIAAAPDLLEASEKFLEGYVRMVNSGDCGNWNPEEEDVVIAMRAAINKARGEK